MKRISISISIIISITVLLFASCTNTNDKKDNKTQKTDTIKTVDLKKKVDAFAEFELNADISHLSDNQKKMLGIFFDIAKIMDNIFWKQTYGNKAELFEKLKTEDEKAFCRINYGPWERLNADKPFINGIKEKPKGVQFYPKDMTTNEFELFDDADKISQYTVIRRDENGKLKTVWYHDEYKNEITQVVKLLEEAAELAENENLKKYLLLRAKAFQTDDYFESDLAWMNIKDNDVDFVVGPIETYEDALYGYKASHEAFILIKDKEWSKKLKRFAALMPEMQKQLPVDDKYKKEEPGRGSDLGAYQVVYYAGDANSGGKTIAINLPNDERVHLEKGSRRLQLKNAMQAKFDKILIPIADLLIAKDQRKHITFDAFFENTMFHETAHGLGIKETINGKGKVRDALKEVASTLEEGKADILGLFFITKLHEMGEFKEKDLMNNYVTFMASIFRSIRFGASSAHGVANMLRFNYFKDRGAFTYNKDTKRYSINFDKMKEAMISLSEKILTIQGDGDYLAAKKWIEEKGMVDPLLQADLDRVNNSGIPMDIVFKQGKEILGL